MTIDEFKQQHPTQAHLEGDALWDAMENALLKQQEGQAIISTTQSFFKQYKLRKLFYYKILKTLMFVEPHESSNMCSVCKKGVSFRLVWIDSSKEVQEPSPCPHCHKPYIAVPNTTLRYRWFQIKSYFKIKIIRFLDWSCIVGSNTDGRYGMFGDERRYVKQWKYNMEIHKETVILKERKWFEYIFIKKY